ncbi:MAG: glycosyltransferase family 2 protein [Gemmatimonadaceae bacterium]|nr:glycosyltransferase family 2 protein [Gemmatimonadaceae bacterium]
MAVAVLDAMSEPARETVSYILPIRSAAPNTSSELRAYIAWIAARAEVIMVDGSSADIFAAHEREWGAGIRHVAPAPDLISPMGKVGGVLTGLRLASHESVIIADDDVRYDEKSLAQVIAALATADVVRPQNYFEPLPWHARWDSGRMLLNRLTGGDWPGTLGVRRSRLQATNGYDGSVMFENLELVRTVLASGGRERVLYGAYVLRRPSTTRHFWSQRVRQAYDEIARPVRFAIQLAVLPIVLTLAITAHWLVLAIGAAVIIAAAELGRRSAGATRVFPTSTPLFAPLWLAERAVCSWLALGARIVLGGVPYRGTILHRAATPMRVLRRRYSSPSAPTILPAPAAPRRSA